MTCEELLFDGRSAHRPATSPTTRSRTSWRLPEIESVFLDDADNPEPCSSSKAIGEPPLMYGIGAYFALLDAMKAFRPTSRSVLPRADDPRAGPDGAPRLAVKGRQGSRDGGVRDCSKKSKV